MLKISQTLAAIKKKNLYPDIHIVEDSSTTPESIVDGKKILIFCSNNYLSVAGDPRVKASMKEAVEKYGMGSGGSRLISGNLDVHNNLEKAIANFKGEESAITFLAGYMANTGVIPAVLKPIEVSAASAIKQLFKSNSAAVFSDELNHASIIDGCRLAQADRVVYHHCDIVDLERKLSRNTSKIKLIVTDGVFSMDGDIAPLDQLVRLGRQYNAMVMVDDAHASGVLGETGKGTAEHFKLKEGVDISMGTFTKSFGGVGGFIVGSRDFMDYLRISARTYIFSAPVPPSISAGLTTAIGIISSEPERRTKLWENVKYMRRNLSSLGFNILGDTQIIPILVGNEDRAINLSRRLFDLGIFAPCVRWPAVAKGQSRIRLTVMTDHTKAQMDDFLSKLESVGKELKLL